MEELSHLEESCQSLEEEIREHAKQSSIQNGRVNVAHARKKRRLDEELESSLEGVEKRRSQITAVEQRIEDHTFEKEGREADMVALEQELVQILIEQQKLVLDILSSAKQTENKGNMLLKIVGLADKTL